MPETVQDMTDVIKPERIRHLWIAVAHDDTVIMHHILCWFMTGNKPDWQGEINMASTRIEELVNCKACLECLHA